MYLRIPFKILILKLSLFFPNFNFDFKKTKSISNCIIYVHLD